MLECVVNISEGRDLERVARIAAAAGTSTLDVHSDPHHHRSVLTVIGEAAAAQVAQAAVEEIDLGRHEGVHPRMGAVDVVPFVALEGSTATDALAARDRFARWFADTQGVPCFLYGPERTLPEVRRQAFRTLAPDAGPVTPSSRSGSTAVGQRDVLIAYNVWLHQTDLATVRRIAAAVRGPGIRALGLAVGAAFQISMNLIDPEGTGPAAAFDRVAEAVATSGTQATLAGAELVGLLPSSVLRAIPTHRWAELDLAAERTIEARLEERGLR